MLRFTGGFAGECSGLILGQGIMKPDASAYKQTVPHISLNILHLLINDEIFRAVKRPHYYIQTT
jgi:hypothetical protein